MPIQIIDGFQVNTALPIDNRIVASGSAARNALPYKYEGLRVFDTSDSLAYVWVNGAWANENASGVNGSGTTANYVPLITSSNVIGNSVIYQNTNKIGINTTSPSELFEVANGNIKVSGTGYFIGNGQAITNLNASNVSSGSLPLARIFNGSTGYLLAGGSSGSPVYLDPTQVTVGTSSTSINTSVVNNSSNASNYVTFVGSLASQPLRVNNSLLYNPAINLLTTGTISVVKINSPGGNLSSTNGSIINHANFTSFSTNANRLEINTFRNSAGSSWISSGHRIQAKVDNEYMGYIQFNGTGNETGISFGTGYMNNNNYTDAFEKMRINYNGVVIIAGTSSYGSPIQTNLTAQLYVGTTQPLYGPNLVQVQANSYSYDGLVHRAWNNTNWIFSFQNSSGTTRGNIQGNGSSGVVYNTSSDRRLKTSIEDMPSMYDKIKNLKPSKFFWKEDKKEDFGFIAQDVYKVLPNLRGDMSSDYFNLDDPNFDIDNPVRKDGTDHYYGLDYGKFTPYLTKALQETMEKLETLTDKIKTASSLEDLKNSL